MCYSRVTTAELQRPPMQRVVTPACTCKTWLTLTRPALRATHAAERSPCHRAIISTPPVRQERSHTWLKLRTGKLQKSRNCSTDTDRRSKHRPSFCLSPPGATNRGTARLRGAPAPHPSQRTRWESGKRGGLLPTGRLRVPGLVSLPVGASTALPTKSC